MKRRSFPNGSLRARHYCAYSDDLDERFGTWSVMEMMTQRTALVTRMPVLISSKGVGASSRFN